MKTRILLKMIALSMSILWLCFSELNAQVQTFNCPTDALRKKEERQSPVYAAQQQAYEEFYRRYTNEKMQNSVETSQRTVYTVPVVFHIFHAGRDLALGKY